MESTEHRPSATEASAALSDAEASRAMLAQRIRTPPWFFTSIGAAIAAQIALTAVALSWSVGGSGIAALSTWTIAAFAAGVAVLLAVAGVQLAAFRQLNGVWVGGLLSRVVLGTGALASGAYIVALGAAIWSAIDAQWWLVATSSVIGGAAYALAGRRWFNAYRDEPARHARRESVVMLGLAVVAALVGLGLLLIYR
ncbi:MAG TPA: hypothetical protein VIZ22_05910 [Candidatus Limnocylindrales bacterium]